MFTSNKDGIKDRLIGKEAPGVISTAIKEKLEWKLLCAEQGPRVTASIYPYLSNHDVRKFLIDQLNRLDCAKVFLKKNTRSVYLSSQDIYGFLARLDFRDLPSSDQDVMSCIAGVSLAVTLLYCVYLRKTVEAKTLLNLDAGIAKNDSKRVVEISVEMLNDIRHFNKGLYDHMVMDWWDATKEKPVGKLSRYAY